MNSWNWVGFLEMITWCYRQSIELESTVTCTLKVHWFGWFQSTVNLKYPEHTFVKFHWWASGWRHNFSSLWFDVYIFCTLLCKVKLPSLFCYFVLCAQGSINMSHLGPLHTRHFCLWYYNIAIKRYAIKI